MQQTVEPPPHSPSFAGLLASLATAGHRRLPSWDEEELDEDVASLSYERALRTHARFRPSAAEERPPVETAPASADPDLDNRQNTDNLRIVEAELNPSPSTAFERDPARGIGHQTGPTPSDWHPDRHDEPDAELATETQAPSDAARHLGTTSFHPGTTSFSAADRNLKSASITIRLSEAECRQLRERAASAGLTVSAYLRSCTVEAESLRAMVKDTLAQLRSAPASENPQPCAPAPQAQSRSWRGWLQKLLAHLRLNGGLTQRIAQT
jgi:predicted DNA binding CopG/RHH family protein